MRIKANIDTVRMGRDLESLLSHDIPRAVGFALNGVAIAAASDIRKGLDGVIDQPSPWFLRGLDVETARLPSRGETARIDDLQPRIYVREDQSAVWKYLMGDSDQTREPGDVGPGAQKIFIPIWSNLSDAPQNINSINGQTMPRSTLKRLTKDAKSGRTKASGRGKKRVVERIKRNTGDRDDVFYGRPSPGAAEGFYQRPRRVSKKAGGSGQPEGAPRLLIAAVDEVTVKPILEALWQKSVDDNYRSLPNRVEREIAQKIKRRRTTRGTT